ncbi:MAG: serine/threonine-protein kinase [Myxococcota bacterium]|nr:serine/threonine-protein kinase [Myxococcota bacterium]
MLICPECRSLYHEAQTECDRDGVSLIAVQASQDARRYPLLNQELDQRYHLIGGLGQGGAGMVYLAQRLHLDRLVAVKFLDPDNFYRVDEEQREEARQEFLREAQAATVVDHPSVVRLVDYGFFDEMPYLVMDYIPGPSLHRRLKRAEPFSLEGAISFAVTLAEALSALHERRLVHRDIKPANVILHPQGDGRLTLVDLGLVKDLSRSAMNSTHPMALRGTPGYLAPEQVPGWVLNLPTNQNAARREVDARVDIYASGVIFYEILAGSPPYPQSLGPTQTIVHTSTQDPPSLLSAAPHLSEYPELLALVDSMIARDPSQRPKDGGALLHKLREIERTFDLDGEGELDDSLFLQQQIEKTQSELVQLLNRKEKGRSNTGLTSQGLLERPPAAKFSSSAWTNRALSAGARHAPPLRESEESPTAERVQWAEPLSSPLPMSWAQGDRPYVGAELTRTIEDELGDESFTDQSFESSSHDDERTALAFQRAESTEPRRTKKSKLLPISLTAIAITVAAFSLQSPAPEIRRLPQLDVEKTTGARQEPPAALVMTSSQVEAEGERLEVETHGASIKPTPADQPPSAAEPPSTGSASTSGSDRVKPGAVEVIVVEERPEVQVLPSAPSTGSGAKPARARKRSRSSRSARRTRQPRRRASRAPTPEKRVRPERLYEQGRAAYMREDFRQAKRLLSEFLKQSTGASPHLKISARTYLSDIERRLSR